MCFVGLSCFLDTTFKVGGEDIVQLFATLTDRWVVTLRESLDSMDEDLVRTSLATNTLHTADIIAIQRATVLLWFKYIDSQVVLHLLEYLAERAEHSGSTVPRGIIESVLEVTADALTRDMDATTQALPVLCRLHSLIPRYPRLTSLIASGTRGCIPLCHDGYLPELPSSESNLASLVSLATKRWSLRLQPLPSLSIRPLLEDTNLSNSSVDIVANLLYRDRSARSIVMEWLLSPASKTCGIDHFVRLAFAFCDSARSGDSCEDVLDNNFSRLTKLVAEARRPHRICAMTVDCLVSCIASSSSYSRSKYIGSLTQELSALTVDRLSLHCLSIGKALLSVIGVEAILLAEVLLDVGLRWAVRCFANGASLTDDDRTMLSSMGAYCSTDFLS